MGLFGKLFGKKQISSTFEKKEEYKLDVNKLNIDSVQTNEKFLHLKNVIVISLVENLEKLNVLEKEIFERSKLLKNPNEPNQVQPGEKELWEEYKQRRIKITDFISTKNSETRTNSFGKPTKYEYINYPETKMIFLMKSKNRAVIEIYYEYGIKGKEQFVMKKIEEEWKIDSNKYGFQSEEKWYKDEL